MKTFSTVLFLFLFAQFSSGQHTYLSVSAGISLPSGVFSLEESNSGEGGYAGWGFRYGIDLEHTFGRSPIGIGVTYRNGKNSADTRQYLQDSKLTFPGGTQSSFSESLWQSQALLGGVVAKLPFSDVIDLNLKAMVGNSWIDSPEFQYNAVLDGSGVWLRQETARESAFAYLFEAGMGLDFQPIYLSLSVDYLSTNVSFDQIQRKDSAGSNESLHYAVPIRCFTPYLGFALNF